jgi:putative SOS response-associated peptidase YedK
MCGRFEIHSAIEIIAGLSDRFDHLRHQAELQHCAEQDVAVVKNDGKKNCLVSCHWGFVPSWSKELKTGYSMINARPRTATNSTFSEAFLNTRCRSC